VKDLNTAHEEVIEINIELKKTIAELRDEGAFLRKKYVTDQPKETPEPAPEPTKDVAEELIEEIKEEEAVIPAAPSPSAVQDKTQPHQEVS
jgi:hypothetical protein